MRRFIGAMGIAVALAMAACGPGSTTATSTPSVATSATPTPQVSQPADFDFGGVSARRVIAAVTGHIGLSPSAVVLLGSDQVMKCDVPAGSLNEREVKGSDDTVGAKICGKLVVVPQGYSKSIQSRPPAVIWYTLSNWLLAALSDNTNVSRNQRICEAAYIAAENSPNFGYDEEIVLFDEVEVQGQQNGKADRKFAADGIEAARSNPKRSFTTCGR